MPLTDVQRELCESSPFDFSDLQALYVNCTLKYRGRAYLTGAKCSPEYRTAARCLRMRRLSSSQVHTPCSASSRRIVATRGR
jgi:hypothetical protein